MYVIVNVGINGDCVCLGLGDGGGEVWVETMIIYWFPQHKRVFMFVFVTVCRRICICLCNSKSCGFKV